MNILDHKLDKETPVPLYFQLKSLIMENINNGDLKPGDLLPTETEFTTAFGISRSTVRQALSELSSEGWVDRKTSKGTFVTTPQKDENFIRSFEPFYRQITKRNQTPRTELISINVIPASEELQMKLGINEDDKVISIFRRRFADDEPMLTIQNFMPYSLCAFVLGTDFSSGSLYELLMTNEETKINKTKTVVSADCASSSDAKLLNVSLASPILCIHNTAYNANGQVLDYAFSRYRGDKNKFEIIETPHTASS